MWELHFLNKYSLLKFAHIVYIEKISFWWNFISGALAGYGSTLKDISCSSYICQPVSSTWLQHCAEIAICPNKSLITTDKQRADPHTLKMGKTNQTHTSTASAYTDLLSVRCQICKKGNLFLPACGDISICQISHWFTFSAFNNSQSPQSLKISMEVFMNHAVTCYLGDSAVGRVFRIRFCAVSGKKWSRCTAWGWAEGNSTMPAL